MPRRTDTRSRILDVAEDLLQDRGFNGFSYKDVAGALGIRNAAVHYHFPAKADLGVELVERARTDVDRAAVLRRGPVSRGAGEDR